MLDYRIELRCDPALGKAAAARLRAALPPDASPADRLKVEKAATALAGSGFFETSELSVARESGILVRLRSLIGTRAVDGSSRTISTRSIDLAS